MSNLDYIRQLPIGQLAVLLVREKIEHTVDYDWDENPVDGPDYGVFETSDGEQFDDYEQAIQYEIWWLGQEYRTEARSI